MQSSKSRYKEYRKLRGFFGQKRPDGPPPGGPGGGMGRGFGGGMGMRGGGFGG